MIVGLSAGRDSSPELRARLALTPEQQVAVLRAPHPGLAEAVLICTCHRTEVYATGDGPEADLIHSAAAILPGLHAEDQHEMRFLTGTEAAEHVFRVACGLDSLVVGEQQVLGQVRRAIAQAHSAGSAGPVLSDLFRRAVALGRRVRASTAIGALQMSIGSLVAEHLAHVLGPLDGKRGVVIGAGEAAADAAEWLFKAHASLDIVSRTHASAERLAAEYHGRPHTMRELDAVLDGADFCVVAVSGGHQLTLRGLPVIDISVPLVAQPGPNVITLEDLPGPRGPEVAGALAEAGALVAEEVALMERWADTRSAGSAVKSLRDRAHRVASDEIARAGLDLDTDQAARVERLVRRLTNKLIHGPTTALRTSDADTRKLIKKIFGIEE